MTEKKDEADATSTAGNVPNDKDGKPPRAQGDRAKRYTEKGNTRELNPELLPGGRRAPGYKTR